MRTPPRIPKNSRKDLDKYIKLKKKSPIQKEIISICSNSNLTPPRRSCEKINTSPNTSSMQLDNNSFE